MESNRFVPYIQDVEVLQPGEAAALLQLDEMLRKVQKHVYEKHGVALRGTHAKPTAALKGALTVAHDLPPELAQGVFSRLGHTYDVLARSSQGPSDYLSDKASGQRGLAFKLLGLQGQRVWPEELSPYRIVAVLRFPQQDPFSTERARYMEDRISFNPIDSLEAHRALGSIDRARMHVYMGTQRFREQANHVRPAEPGNASEMPD